MNTSKVWFVTGASRGLGLSLVKKLLDNGYRVAATSRNAHLLSQAVGLIDHDRFLPLAVDLNNTDCISDAVQQTVLAFGRIDVLVNNAGYGMVGALEEIPEQEVKNLFDTNVLATIHVTKRILPVMRRQRSGYILNIGSVAGFAGAHGWAVYAATKAAVAAFSEVMALDVKEFGIKVTVVEPSGFRTGFLTPDSLVSSSEGAGEYEAVKHTQERYLSMNGQQAGDPDQAAAIFIAMAENPAPPLHLFLGKEAYNRASEKIAAMSAELEQWKPVTISADFPA